MNFPAPEFRREERVDEKKVVSEVIRDAVIHHDTEHPDRLSFLLSYGSKQLTCFIDKAGGTAGAIIESTDESQRKEKETTIIYRALLGMFQGVANKLLQPVEYTLVTENPKLIQWAQTTGDTIFHWISSRNLDQMKSFTCAIEPRLAPEKVEGRKRSATARRLMWEEREKIPAIA